MFTFSTVDLLNATITSSGPISFRTKTSVGFTGRKTTSLMASASGQERVVGGIDWREKDLVVLGKTWDLHGLKSRPTGPVNTLRVWHWAGENYKVDLYGKQWTVTPARQLTPLVTLSQSVQRIFKASKPATIQIHAGLSELDTIFWILVLIYSEVRWQDEDIDGHLRSEHSD
ncbi:hypothetical protein LshimejAT787_0411260 [Lyophyllum shimeji]|uniref:DUF6593 domain-containing protein n=1 Tax=Lyophyllum shimeji TaxID=47721 RepID=A0A9P3PLE4_LYOSH|nr:hypothetical protein LshimejAT787_0411260 [Lyophyllum shimeji]